MIKRLLDIFSIHSLFIMGKFRITDRLGHPSVKGRVRRYEKNDTFTSVRWIDFTDSLLFYSVYRKLRQSQARRQLFCGKGNSLCQFLLHKKGRVVQGTLQQEIRQRPLCRLYIPMSEGRRSAHGQYMVLEKQEKNFPHLAGIKNAFFLSEKERI